MSFFLGKLAPFVLILTLIGVFIRWRIRQVGLTGWPRRLVWALATVAAILGLISVLACLILDYGSFTPEDVPKRFIQIALAVTGAGALACIALAAWLLRNGMPIPRPSWKLRLLEALAVVGLSVTLLILQIIQRNWPADIPPQLSRAHALVIDACLLGAVGAGLLALVGRLWLSAALVALVAIFYGHATSDGWEPNPGGMNNQYLLLARWAGLPNDGRQDRLTIESPVGVEVWLNGVNLGTTPLTILSDDLAKVPHWDDLPGGWPKKEQGWTAKASDGLYYTKFAYPGGDHHSLTPDQMHPDNDKRPVYYLQMKLDGEWGKVRASGASGSGQALGMRYRSSYPVDFPQHNVEIDMMIRNIKDSGYKLTNEWTALDGAVRELAWERLSNACQKDRQLQAIRQAWAAQRYKVPPIKSAPQARSELERLIAVAETQEKYNTDSMLGQAIESLVPQLDTQAIITAARQCLNVDQITGYSWGGQGRPANFSSVPPDDSPSLLVRLANSPHRQRPFVLAHVAWKKSQQLDAADLANPIRTDLLGELVYRQFPNEDAAIQIAQTMGWPGLYEFLIRHDWSRQVGQGYEPDAKHLPFMSNMAVSKWFWALVNLPGPEGKRFRLMHAYEVEDLARRMMREDTRRGPTVSDDLNFLFLDAPDPRCAGLKLWPEFLRAEDDAWKLQRCVAYLGKLGDAATVPMYVQAMRSCEREPVEGMIALRNLPQPRRQQIGQALMDELAAVESGAKSGPGWMHNARERDSIRRELNRTTGVPLPPQLAPATRPARPTRPATRPATQPATRPATTPPATRPAMRP